jgi:outer membrane protein assembly factor BamB
MYVGLSTSNSAPGLSYLAVDLATREVLWQTPDVGTMAHLVSGNQIFVREANARMTAIDARSGTIRWQTDTSNSAHASGSPHVLLAGRLYYPHYLGLRVLDADDGELVHVEPLHDGYLWEVVAGAGRIVGQYSGTIVAYHPFGGAGR